MPKPSPVPIPGLAGFPATPGRACRAGRPDPGWGFVRTTPGPNPQSRPSAQFPCFCCDLGRIRVGSGSDPGRIRVLLGDLGSCARGVLRMSDPRPGSFAEPPRLSRALVPRDDSYQEGHIHETQHGPGPALAAGLRNPVHPGFPKGHRAGSPVLHQAVSGAAAKRRRRG